MPCGMERNRHSSQPEFLAKFMSLDRDLLAKAGAHQGNAAPGGIVLLCPPPCVVGMGMGHHGPVHPTFRIDVEVASFAVEALLTENEHYVQGSKGRFPKRQFDRLRY